MKWIFIIVLLSPFYLNGQNSLPADNEFVNKIEIFLKTNDIQSIYEYTLSTNSKNDYIYDKNTLLYKMFFLAFSQANVGKPTDAMETLDALSNKFIVESSKYKIFFLKKGVRGIIKYRQGNYLKAIEDLTLASSKLGKFNFENKLDNYLLALFYRFLGRAYSETGIYLQAISILQKSSDIFSKLGNIENTFINDKYIGRVYQSSKIVNNIDGIAIKKYKEALHGFKTYEMKDEIPWIYTIIADYYIKNNEIKLAKQYQDSTFNLLYKNETLLKGLTYNNYGEILELEKKIIKAKRNYYKAIEIYKKIDNYSNRAVTYYNLPHICLKEKDFLQSKLFADSSLIFAKKTQNFDKLSNIYNQLSQIYKFNLDFKNAYYYLLKSSNISDSLMQKQNITIAHSYNALYQIKEKEKENQKLQYENIKVKSKNVYRTTFLIFIFTLIIFGFILNSKNQKSKFNKLIIKEIDEQNNIIAKNLHDGMSGYLHSVRDSLLFKNTKTENLANEIDIIKRSQNELRFLMKQLNSPFYKNKNFNLLEELSDLNNFYENTSKFSIVSYFDDTIAWNSISYENKLQLYKLVQELLANVKKHSGASEISLQIIKDKNYLILSIEDNGKGFDTEIAFKGYGLKNMEKRIKEMKGKMKIDSNIGEGTFISFKLQI